jgi:hypothetical protein
MPNKTKSVLHRHAQIVLKYVVCLVTSFLKKATGRIFTIYDFIEVSRNCIFDGLHKKQPQNVKTISAHPYGTDMVMIFRALKKYSSRDTIP